MAGTVALDELIAPPRTSRGIGLFHAAAAAREATRETDRRSLETRGASPGGASWRIRTPTPEPLP